METGAAVEKSVGRRGGQREAGKKGREGGVGDVERGLGVSGPPSMWRISWSTVELSCHALLCWSGTE